MSEQLTLPAESRDRAGKGASRELRRSGRVPAVIYGDKKEALSIHVEEKLLTRMLSTGHFMNTVVMIDAGGTPHRTLPKDVQFHPVSSRPIHVDFLRIGEHSQVHVNVPVHFIDELLSPGIKRGGVLTSSATTSSWSATRPKSPSRSRSASRASTSATRSTSRT